MKLGKTHAKPKPRFIVGMGNLRGCTTYHPTNPPNETRKKKTEKKYIYIYIYIYIEGPYYPSFHNHGKIVKNVVYLQKDRYISNTFAMFHWTMDPPSTSHGIISWKGFFTTKNGLDLQRTCWSQQKNIPLTAKGTAEKNTRSRLEETEKKNWKWKEGEKQKKHSHFQVQNISQGFFRGSPFWWVLGDLFRGESSWPLFGGYRNAK